MIDQFQLRALGEKLKVDTDDKAREINQLGREHLEYLDALAAMLAEFAALVDQQRHRFAHYSGRPAVEPIPQRQRPRITEQVANAEK